MLFIRQHAWTCSLALMVIAIIPVAGPTPKALTGSTVNHTNQQDQRPPYQQCLDDTDGMDIFLKGCMNAEYEYQTQRINRTYASLISRLDPQARLRLSASERTWATYRSSHCSANPAPQSGEAPDINGCSVDETTKHADSLENELAIQKLH